MCVRWFLPVLVAVLVACGRIGFDPGTTGDGGPRDAPVFDALPGPITVTLLGGADAGAGAPIANGYVLFVDGRGTTVVRTDAGGRATFEAVGATDVHAAYGLDMQTVPSDWRVITVQQVGGGTDLVLGGPDVTGGPTSGLTIDVPAEPNADSYSAVGPSGCIVDQIGVMVPSLPVSFSDSCSGELKQLFGMAEDSSGALTAWLDLGTITLTPGATVTAGGSWQPPTTYLVEVDGFTGQTALAIVRSSDSLGLGIVEVTASGPVLIPAIDVPADRLLAVAYDLQFSSVRGSLKPLPSPDALGIRHVTAAALLPEVRDPSYEPAGKTIRWQQGTGPSRAPIVASAFTAFIGPQGDHIDWTIHARAPTLGLQLATLPAELERLAPPAVLDDISVVLTSVEGQDYVATVNLIARSPDTPLVLLTMPEPVEHLLSMGTVGATALRTAADRVLSGAASRHHARARRPAR